MKIIRIKNVTHVSVYFPPYDWKVWTEGVNYDQGLNSLIWCRKSERKAYIHDQNRILDNRGTPADYMKRPNRE